MHVYRVLDRWFERNCCWMHRACAKALIGAVSGLLRGGTLTLTHLGRSLPGSSFTKHKIKAVDRLLGNSRLHRERLDVYREMSATLLSGAQRPVILVDWSDFEPGHRWLMLKAAVAVHGRAITVYEEAHRLSSYNNPGTHRRFLGRLARVIPSDCHPIIVTDAGFRGPWFQEVAKLGWDFVGRVRNRIKCTPEGGERWRYTTSLYRRATHRVQHLGLWELSRKQPYTVRLYLSKMPSRGPGRPLKSHTKTKTPARSRKAYNDPWLIATSLEHGRGRAKAVMKLYRKRMQIEETFRDLKDDRWGFALVLARSRSRQRREILLLIAALATWALWLLGLAARARRWQRHFQANTERAREVLSVVFLGRELLRSRQFSPDRAELSAALHRLRALIRNQVVLA